MMPLSLPAAGLFALYLSVTPVSSQESEGPRRRSVVFYLMDTCRKDRLGIDGYERETTPFLDELAQRSVVFEACYTQAPWTKPSMASILTSQYPSTTGVYRMEQRLPDDFVTWPEVLQAQGYFTAGFSTNIVMGNTLSNFAQGFTHFTEGTSINEGDAIRFASGSAKKLNRHAFEWLDRNDHWPLLLYLHSVDPHEEYEPAAPYLEQFADPARDPAFREEWRKLLASRPEIPGLYVTQDNFDATGVDAPSFLAHASNLYDADIRANDDDIADLWKRLEQDGWGQDFVFVFTSDHGEEFFDHGGTSHGYSLYDEMLRVPLMIYAPGLVPAGKRVKTPVRSLDIYPTLCELLGVEAPAGLQGTSLVPLMRGVEPELATEIYSEHREDPVTRRLGQGSGVLVSLRLGRWKIILNEKASQFFERPRVELYDVVNDPREATNLAERYPSIVKWLEPKVVAFVATHRKDANVNDWAADPAVLAQLRALGYVGEEAPAPDLWEVLAGGDLVAIRRRLDAGADANQLEPELAILPLSFAAMRGNLELVELLVGAGAGVNRQGEDGSTPLIGAAFLGRVDILDFLLERGADPTSRNQRGEGPLEVTRAPWDATVFIASLFAIELDRDEVEAGRATCADRLREALKSKKDPGEPLFTAIAQGRLEDVERLLAGSVDLERLDPMTGRTPLQAALFHQRMGIARRLLAAGARVDARDRDGAGALQAAALVGDVAAIEFLLEHGARVDLQDSSGASPLHAAAFLGHAAAVERLLAAKADPRATNHEGRTPLEISRLDWETTSFVMRRLGIELERSVVEQGRAAVAELLGD